jgi:hypothetical protein
MFKGIGGLQRGANKGLKKGTTNGLARGAVSPYKSNRLLTTLPTVANLVAHYDASITSSILTPLGGVSQWSDLSGNGNHLVQATKASQPIYKGFGKNAVVAFDGIDDFLAASFVYNQPETIYFVGTQYWEAGATIFGGGTTANRMQLFMNSVSVKPAISLVATSALSPNSLAFLDRNTMVVCCIFNGAFSTITVNDANRVTGNPGAVAGGGFTLGRDAATAGTNSIIEVKEVLLYSTTAHTLDQQTSIVNALRLKWSI